MWYVFFVRFGEAGLFLGSALRAAKHHRHTRGAMKQIENKRKLLAGALLVGWLAFIWGNSCLSGAESGAVSGWASRFLAEILGTWAPQGEHILRKAAHFTEFALLGGLFAWNARLWGKQSLSLPLLGGLLAAMVDETLQLFSPGRASMVTDVWIDFAGVATGALLLHLIRRGQAKSSKHK